MAPPKSAIAQLFDFFHTHPRGRLFEFLFFTAIGALLAGIAYFFFKRGQLAEPLFWLLVLVALCFVGFALLPQKKKAPPPPPPKGKRGMIAEQVKRTKAEKRKGPPPPIH